MRNLLQDCLPTYFVIDSLFLNNFRKRVAIHHAKHPDGTHLTHDVATRLTKRCSLKRNEIDELEDPLIRNNFRAMYKEIMSESSNTWQVLNYLQKCKVQITGFDFRIQHSTDGRPIAIMWMTPTMRTNLLRYSHILFLDCQKRQMNKIAWPYMGPSVLNSENRVAVCCEAIVTAEDIDTYTWVIKSMLDIEPRWSLACIDIIFADCFITDKLLTNLGIKDT